MTRNGARDYKCAVFERIVLRARVLRGLGHGQRYLVERELAAGGQIRQRINPGIPETVARWKTVGRWSDLERERQWLAEHGWQIEA